jgi:phage-related protein
MVKGNVEILHVGAKHQICAIIENGRCPAKDFIDSLNGLAQKKIIALLNYTAEYGPPINKEKFQKLTDYDLFEFKDYQTRIFCTFEKDKIIILTHGFIKKKEKTPKSEIGRAFELLEKYRNGR